MKYGIRAGLAAAAACACAAAWGAEPAPARAGAANDAQTRQALRAVEKVLRGERVSELDLKNLDDAVIRLETTGSGGALGGGKGSEAAPGEGRGLQKNIYLLRFDTGAGNERQVQVLRIQREILKNQLVLLKSLGAIANYQVNLGTRTARVENIMRDMTLGMKSSGSDMQKVAGDTAGTSAKMTDVANTTTDMAAGMKEMARNIGEIEGAIGSVDSMIRQLASSVDDQGDEMARGMKRMGARIDGRIDGLESEMTDQNQDLQRNLGNQMDSMEDDLSRKIDEDTEASAAE